MSTQRRCPANGFWKAQPLGLSAALLHVLDWSDGSGNCDNQEAKKINASLPFSDFIKMSDAGLSGRDRQPLQ